jgi:colanic acid/amylovoran biosynthesis glycosyltransferase
MNPGATFMRIAFLVYSFPELAETFVLNQVTGLIDAGHDVDVYASGAGNGTKTHADIQRYQLRERTHYWNIPRNYVVRGVKAVGFVRLCWRRPKVLVRALNASKYGRRALSLTLLYTSVRFLDQRPYDIVHCQFATLGRMAMALQDTGAVAGKLVVAFRGSDLTIRGRIPNYEDLFLRGHLFLPVCEKFRGQLIAHGCDSRKIRVHHSGIRLSRFPYVERRRAADEPTRVLSVGRLVEKKGIAYAIEAMAHLKASGRRVLYTVAGAGPLRGELERKVGELGLREEVHLVGPKNQEEVIALLRGAHLLVAPCVTAASGDQEGIPNVLKEAMATGIPVVSTQHSGIPELVQDGVSGLLAPERSSTALAERLAHLIDHPERWPTMGRAGRARVEAEFDSAKLNAELAELYQRVLSDGDIES